MATYFHPSWVHEGQGPQEGTQRESSGAKVDPKPNPIEQPQKEATPKGVIATVPWSAPPPPFYAASGPPGWEPTSPGFVHPGPSPHPPHQERDSGV